jgi:hypothetical protein
MKKFLTFLLIIIIVISFIALLTNISFKNNPEKKYPDKIDAYTMSQIFVEKQLKSPSTAKFPTTSHATITKVDSIYSVSCYVDAQNSFGAIIRTYYTAKISFDKKAENWTLRDLKLNQK